MATMATATTVKSPSIDTKDFCEIAPERPARTHVDSSPVPTDSLVSVSLSSELDPEESSEMDTLIFGAPQNRNTVVSEGNASSLNTMEESPVALDGADNDGRVVQESSDSNIRMIQEVEDIQDVREDAKEDATEDVKEDAHGDATKDAKEDTQVDAMDQSEHECAVEVVDGETARRVRSGSTMSESSTRVDWPELEKSERAEPKDEASDESTAFLLAQLEQANNALATDPKSGLKTVRPRAQSRPPSVYQLRRMVEDPASPNPRFSILPSPPPMTELEFWTALVQDYPQTAQRLPTLTSNKIRVGIPPPLRGVVWMSLAGARDIELENKFDSLCNLTSPHEGAISKDIGRSFPGVEMFRDADGNGQRMLGRVLTAFSLYDPQIGYCQGLGFLVGPLLMQMGEREAFCVLVRLMERYDLRHCFLPDLSGLHLRIYQFQQMLAKHMPQLAAHLDSLQVEAAYLSQWFLSLFAVTCPLPMLFRIYDVILAEGASETLMRVAMSLMRRNEKRIMASSEFEEVMQLLLSRSLWEPYGLNADELVNDFVGFTGMVTHDGLQVLESKFKTFNHDATATEALSPTAQATASSFLGRLWLGSPSIRNHGSLSPKTPGSASGPFLRRTPSKQSMASTLNSVEDAGSSNPSSASTNSSSTMSDNTEITRNSSADAMSLKSGIDTANARATMSSRDRDLHGQIEDLLTALSEMQRDHAVLTMHLQQEREERDEDHRVVRSLLDRIKTGQHQAVSKDTKRKSSPWFSSRQSTLAPPSKGHARSFSAQGPKSAGYQNTSFAPTDIDLPEEIVELVETVDLRFSIEIGERKPPAQTKQQLRDSLARAKEQLQIESSHFQDLTRQVDEQDKEDTYVRQKLEEVCSELKESQEEREKLALEVEELRAEKTPPCSCNSNTPKASKHRRTNSNSSTSSNSSSDASKTRVVRPFRLQRPPSQSMAPLQTQALSESESESDGVEALQYFPKRISSLTAPAVLAKNDLEQGDRDALLQELVNAKTGEAVARQELEELKAKMEALRRVLGPGSASNSPNTPNGHSMSILGHKQRLNSVSRTDTVPVTKHEKEELVKDKEQGKEKEKEKGEKGSEEKSENDKAKDGDKEKDNGKGRELSPHQTQASSGGGGFWGWSKRSFSSSNISPPSK